ncbi:hypothetical protein ACLBR5_18130 [Escherichia coli]
MSGVHALKIRGLNTGHGTLGWTISRSGQLLSDLLSGCTPAIPYEDLSVARYSLDLRHHARAIYMAHTAKETR